MRKALIVWGGWDGHEPEQVSRIFADILEEASFDVELANDLEAFRDADKLLGLDLIVPVWTMDDIEQQLVDHVSAAVQQGTGLAGCHGGMCDAFRKNVDWQFMTGGQWVAHPGNDGVEYTVNIKPGSSPLVEGIADFQVKSEQYYLHIDPAIEVLATTTFPIVDGPHRLNGQVQMPVAWTKRWGTGRVYYNSLGHHADIVDMPPVKEMMRRGLLWAADGKTKANADINATGQLYSGMADSQ